MILLNHSHLLFKDWRWSAECLQIVADSLTLRNAVLGQWPLKDISGISRKELSANVKKSRAPFLQGGLVTRMARFVTILFITSQKVFPRTKKGPQTSSWSQVSHDRTRLTLTLAQKPFSHPKPPASAKLLPWQQPQFLRCKMYWKIKIVEITCPSIALPSYHCGAGQVSFSRIMTICVTRWLTS